MFAIANAPGNDEITAEQMLFFKAVLPHIDRASRIHRELRVSDLDHDTAPERLECLWQSVILVDRAARVLFANAAARRLLGSGAGLVWNDGCLESTDGSSSLQGAIASCAPKALAPNGPGGDVSVCDGRGHAPLRVTVTPLRSRGAVAVLPWLSTGMPVALVTVAGPDSEAIC